MKTLLEVALKERGVKEVSGTGSNPRIDEYIRSVDGKLEDSKYPWCSAFLCWCAQQAGLPFKKSGLARSWLSWGRSVDLPQAQPGDVVVLWREPRSSGKGHVGLFLSQTANLVTLYGGNTANKVGEGVFPRSRVLGVRRALAGK